MRHEREYRWALLGLGLSCLLLAWLPGRACAGAVVLDSELNQVSPHLQIFEDPGGHMDLAAVRATARAGLFRPNGDGIPNLGYSDSAFWARVVLRSAYSEQWVLAIAAQKLDFVDLYFRAPSGEWVHKASGELLPFAIRDIPSNEFAFFLPLSQGVETPVYVRVKSSDAVSIPVTVWSGHRYFLHNSASRLLYGFFYGMLMFAALLFLGIYAGVGRTMYAYLSLFLLSYMFVPASLDGFAGQYLWGNHFWWSKHSLPFFEALSIMFGVLFTRSFLNIRRGQPLFYRMLRLLAVLALGTALLSLFIPYRWAIWGVTLLGLATIPAVLWMSIRCWLLGYRSARFFLLAWSAFLLGALTYMLTVITILPRNSLTESSMHLGAVLLALLIGFASLDRYKSIQKQKVRAQQRVLNEQRRTLEFQEAMMQSTSRFVPKPFLSFLGKTSVMDVRVKDAVLKDICIMFSDIRGFTGMSESMPPSQTLSFLNHYLEYMEPVIEARHGFVDKFIGDAIMALFPDSADQAVSAAIEMQQALQRFNHETGTSGFPHTSCGIGIHCGKVMLGTIGTESRIDTSVIGDSVNIASRLEALTKKYGVSIIISESVYAQLDDPEALAIREIAYEVVRGTSHPMRVYEVLDADPDALRVAKLARQTELAHALQLIREERHGEALPVLVESEQRQPGDPVVGALITICRTETSPRKRATDR